MYIHIYTQRRGATQESPDERLKLTPNLEGRRLQKMSAREIYNRDI